MHVVVVGPMAVGKSTVARGLAASLGRPVRDSDDDLRATRGFSGRELAETAGVDALHRWEAEHLRRALARREPSVVAAAASTVDDALCRQALGEHLVVWLRASPDTLVGRMARSDHRRSVGRDLLEGIAELAAARAERYRSVADLVVDADEATAGEIVAAVLAELPVTVRSGSGDLRS